MTPPLQLTPALVQQCSVLLLQQTTSLIRPRTGISSLGNVVNQPIHSLAAAPGIHKNATTKKIPR